MKVLILAGGYGTRLYPIIKDTPKPLLEIAGKTLIDHLLESVRGFKDINEIFVVTNEKFHETFKTWAQANKGLPFRLTIVNDGTTTPENRLGSVGDIEFAIRKQHINDDLLILGGDNLFDYSLDSYLSFAQKNRPQVTIGLFDIGNLAEATKFGVVAMDPKGKVTSFEEKPEKPKSSLIAMCCYYLPTESLPFVGEYLKETQKADKAGDYIRWLVQRKSVYGFKFDGRWYDIGSVESYKEAQEKFRRM